MLMVPLPLAPDTACVQLVSLYSVKLTEPVGLSPPVMVAVSVIESCWPTVPSVGLADVAMVGLALRMTICSSGSLHLVVKLVLLVSPE